MLSWIVFPLLGIVVGFLSGLVGIGGGIMLVPMLALIFPIINVDPSVTVHLALGTSLACASLTLLSSSIAYKRHGSFDRDIFYRFLPGIMLGSVIGPCIVHLLPVAVLRIIIGVLLFTLAIHMVFASELLSARKLPNNIILFLSTLVIGLLSSFGGLSGAVLIVPYMMWHGISLYKAVGTAAMCGLFLATVGMVSYMIVGYNIPNLPRGAIGYVYLPAVIFIAMTSVPAAQIAARLASKLSKELLRGLLAMILTLVASKMLFFW